VDSTESVEAGREDVYLIKTDPTGSETLNGSETYNKTFGGSEQDFINISNAAIGRKLRCASYKSGG
jgi:hypothetical protein